METIVHNKKSAGLFLPSKTPARFAGMQGGRLKKERSAEKRAVLRKGVSDQPDIAGGYGQKRRAETARRKASGAPDGAKHENRRRLGAIPLRNRHFGRMERTCAEKRDGVGEFVSESNIYPFI